MEGADALALSNPGNPIGTVFSKKDLEEIICAGYKAGKLVVIDEAYFEFYGESVADLIEKYSNLVVLRTFSKAFGFAGLRIGYLLANEDIVKLIQTLQLPCPVSSLSILAANLSLDFQEEFSSSREEYLLSRESLEERLSSLGYKVISTKTNFLLLEVGSKAQFIAEKLLQEHSIAVSFNEAGGFLRVAIPQKDKVDVLYDSLEKVHSYLQV